MRALLNMRIAVVHSYYSSRQPSGENVVVDAQVEALTSAGHDVLLLARRTDEVQSERFYAVRAALSVASGYGPSPVEALGRFAPDVVHVHNLFPNWSWRWLDTWHGPLVATLHNFRPLCAAGTLFRDGQVCTECPDGDRWAGFKHACYRDSRLATLPLTIQNNRPASEQPVIARADALVTLSPRSRELYERSGVDPSRVHMVPHFVEGFRRASSTIMADRRWLYVGRLTAEKGIRELILHWPGGHRLDVIGDGPLRQDVVEAASRGIRLLGARSNSEVQRSLPAYSGLVFPSRWFEGAFPMVYLEALAAGTPVAALQGSAAADHVMEHETGVVVEDDSGWGRALDQIVENRDLFASNCERSFTEGHTREAWLDSIQRVYDFVTTQRAGSS
jgi:glycosyltransferase involved in cell wall biosynthesis